MPWQNPYYRREATSGAIHFYYRVWKLVMMDADAS